MLGSDMVKSPNLVKKVQISAWALSLAVVIIAVLAWGQNVAWKLGHLSTYQIFPLFGLLAFSIMWSHYMASVLRLHLQMDKTVLKKYYSLTSGVVLLAILLHPGLLEWQLWRDGAGLPPGSYKLYVGASLYWVTILGLISWLIFIAFESHRVFGKKSWWKYVDAASDLAMLAILYHGLRLGTQLQSGWFKIVWYFYGLTLVSALAYIYTRRFKSKSWQP